MGNDLNFDELDQAVNNYMQKSKAGDGQPTPDFKQDNSQNISGQSQKQQQPSASGAESPVSTSEPTRPTQEDSNEVKTITGLSSNQTRSMPATPAKSRLQVQSRQTLSPKPTRSETFHDISPPTRRSSAAVTKRLSPIESKTITSSEQPASVSTQGDSKFTSENKQVSQETPASSRQVSNDKSNSPVVTQENADTTIASTKQSPDTSMPAASKVDTGLPSEMPSMKEGLKDKIELNDDMASQASSDPGESTPPAMPMETNFTPPQEKKEIPPAVQDEAVQANISNEAKDDSSLDASGMNLIEEPSPVEKPTTNNMTGFSADESEHMLGEGKDKKAEMLGATHTANQGVSFDEASTEPKKPMQVFDTKEYHTPISPSEKKDHNKFWMWLIIILITIALLIGAYIVYTLFFATM